MKGSTSILLAMGLIVINLMLAHIYAPVGLFFTPPVMASVTVLLVFGKSERSAFMTSLLLYGLIALNDLGLKVFSGGYQDRPLQRWSFLMLSLGLIPSYGVLLFGILGNRRYTMKERIASIVIFPLLMVLHLFLFDELGLGTYYGSSWFW